MGASSSGLLDETKVTHIKGLVDSAFQSFSVFYRQQYSAAYFGHLHQEVEPKKEGRGLLLSQGPQYAPEEVLYQGSLKFSCWDEQGKKCKERYIVLRRDYKVEIHENKETFGRGGAAKLVLQPTGGRVFTAEEQSRAHLEKTCAGVLNEVKEDSSSVVSSPDVFAVYLHLPYTGHNCFLFQQEEERDHFLSALKTCIRHCNLDPWCDSSYESQAYVQALQLYRRDKGCYESWEMLLGTEEKVLASQVMEEVLPWLQSQLQSRVKGKKTEKIRQWLATVQATYTVVLEQLTARLEALREECRQTASANQALIRSNLDQIMSSHCFLEEKVRACICEEAEKVCSESVAPYMLSILEALTENISAGIQGMRQALHTQMDSTVSHTNGGTGETKKALSSLHSISLDQCYSQVEKLTEKLEGLKQRFGLNSTHRLVHSAHLEMEKLLDSAVYTLELFLQSSARLQPSQVPVKMDRAKERVLKQLDYDSRVVQKRLYQEALLEITLPVLTKRMDSKWKSELQQFEQYIFSDYSSFILVHNVYDDVLRNILSKEIETALQDAASKKSNNLLLDTSDLAISQYSLLGHTPPRSMPSSPVIHARQSTSDAPEAEAQDSTSAAPGAEAQDSTSAVASEEVGDSSTAAASKEVGDSSTVAPSEEAQDSSSAAPSEETQDSSAAASKEARDSSSAAPGEETRLSSSATPSEDARNSSSAEPSEEAPHSSSVAPGEGAQDSSSAAPSEETPDSSSAAATEEASPAVKEGGQTLTIDVCLQGDPELTADAKSEPSITQSTDQRTVLLSPVIIVTQQLDEPSTEETFHFEEAQEEVQLGTDAPSPTADSSESDAGHEAGASDAPVNPSSTNPIPDSSELSVSTLSSLQSTDVPAQSDQPATPENSATPDLPTSDEVTKDITSVQHPCPSSSHLPCTDSPMKISLGSLSEAIGCDTTAPPEMQAMARQPTDRAVYLTGEIKDKWEMERVKEEEQREAAEEKAVHERVEEGREETGTGEGKEEEKQGERVVNEGCQSSECPAESATTLTTKQGEEKVDDEGKGDEFDTEKRKERGEHAEKDGKQEKDEVPQSPQPMESQPDSIAELPLDSVAIIRELVTEITEVETIINPCSNSSQAP
ncbi:protein Niban 1-like [Symphorus nematophorus]